MTTMYRLDENVQIYITNVCNLTCENCITYNNLKFISKITKHILKSGVKN
jgi:uncharacterized radical SAM superfamily Fe-S cluster-containing enzyme